MEKGQNTSIKSIYRAFSESPGKLCTDTRQLKPGDFFVALKGPNFNGNKFAKEALKKGAEYVMGDDPEYIEGEMTFLVKDSLKALQEMAHFHRKKLDIPVLAIGGSNGKTTTKELIAAVLSKKYKTFFTPGNLNNHIGVPLSLLQITKEHEIAVIEMGANAEGEIEQLCAIAEPNYGLITNIGKDHLEGFGSLEGVARANSELYRWIMEHDGTAIVNASDEILMRMARHIPHMVTYPTDNSDYSATILPSEEGMAFRSQNGRRVQTQIFGNYNFHNAAAAVCIGKVFKVAENQALDAVEAYVPKNNRSQVQRTENNVVICDAYNANPSSMALAIKSLVDMPTENNKAVILGEMAELGPYTSEEHHALGAMLDALKEIEEVFLLGKAMKNTAQTCERAEVFEEKGELAEALKQRQLKGYIILLKGSRSNKMEDFMEYL